MSNERPMAADRAEFSHPVALSDLPRNRPFSFDIAPSETEAKAMALLLDAQSVAKLRFSGTVSYDAQDQLILRAHLGVTVTQSCVVTLKPVRTRIEEDIQRRFIEDFDIEEPEYQIREEGDEDLDLLRDPIDLGVIATESVALAMPHYPRAEGAALDDANFAEPGVTPLKDEDMRPFASLAALREKMMKDG